MPGHVPTPDPVATIVEPGNPIERWAMARMKDPRDLIFVRTATAITLLVLPLAALWFASPPWVVGLAAVPYIGSVFLFFGGRFGLMLHANGHRPIYPREHRWLRAYVPWVLGPFFGHTPTSFDAHHMYMHHAEGNLPRDLSTTLPYQRDNFFHFLHYWARFFFFGHIHLSRYLWKAGRFKVLRRFWMGELAWLALALAALWVNWAAALVVFIVPMLMMRWLMMAGNWGQHAFVDVRDPGNPYLNSTNLTNTPYNRKAYNDGYHIVHHLKPALHWSEMPAHYTDNREEYARQDALVFNGIRDNQQIWFLLMSGRYRYLAERLVDFRGRSVDERIALLKHRARSTLGRRARIYEASPVRADADAHQEKRQA